MMNEIMYAQDQCTFSEITDKNALSHEEHVKSAHGMKELH